MTLVSLSGRASNAYKFCRQWRMKHDQIYDICLSNGNIDLSGWQKPSQAICGWPWQYLLSLCTTKLWQSRWFLPTSRKQRHNRPQTRKAPWRKKPLFLSDLETKKTCTDVLTPWLHAKVTVEITRVKNMLPYLQETLSIQFNSTPQTLSWNTRAHSQNSMARKWSKIRCWQRHATKCMFQKTTLLIGTPNHVVQ